MPNVLQLIDSFNQGGTEWQTVQLTRLLHESGKYRVLLASLSAEGPLRAEVERLGFHDIPSFPLQNFYNLNALNQLSAWRRSCAKQIFISFTLTIFIQTFLVWLLPHWLEFRLGLHLAGRLRASDHPRNDGSSGGPSGLRNPWLQMLRR